MDKLCKLTHFLVHRVALSEMTEQGRKRTVSTNKPVLLCLFFNQGSLSTGKLSGDGTGLLKVQNGQQVSIAVAHHRTHIDAGIYTDPMAELYLPPVTHICGVSLNRGGLLGVRHLYVNSNLGLTQQGYSICQNKDDDVDENGRYWFTSVTVLDGGKFGVRSDDNTTVSTGLKLHVDDLNIKHRGQIYIWHTMSVFASRVSVEKSSLIDGQFKDSLWAAGGGYGPASGPGAGCNDGGGGHGGRGGGDCGDTYSSTALPVYRGSGGGNCVGTGGKGGASVKFAASRIMSLEGNVWMNGENGNEGGGAGAGGSIWLDVDTLEGWGTMHAYGGSGTGRACKTYCCSICSCCVWCNSGGGGGGRIRTYTPHYANRVVLFHQKVSGGSSVYGLAGQKGTLYIGPGTQCNGHGTYNITSQTCQCNDGYVGDDCQYECSVATCGGHGTCRENGQCLCDEGRVGYHCEHTCDRNTTCSGHGECGLCGTCICDPCYHGPDCSLMCSGFGECVAGSCVCDANAILEVSVALSAMSMAAVTMTIVALVVPCALVTCPGEALNAPSQAVREMRKTVVGMVCAMLLTTPATAILDG